MATTRKQNPALDSAYGQFTSLFVLDHTSHVSIQHLHTILYTPHSIHYAVSFLLLTLSNMYMHFSSIGLFKRHQVPSFIYIMSKYCLCISYFVWRHPKVDCINSRCLTMYWFDMRVSQFTPLSPLKLPHNSLLAMLSHAVIDAIIADHYIQTQKWASGSLMPIESG